MFSYLRKRRERRELDRQAYDLGVDAGNAQAADIATIVDELIAPKREGFLMVLDQRLTGIRPVDGVSYQEQAKIEFTIMRENWSEHRGEQEDEVFRLFWAKWGSVLETVDPDHSLTKSLIAARLDDEFVKLFDAGLQNTADAIERDRQMTG